MSFSSDVKRELCQIECSTWEQMLSECYAMTVFGKNFYRDKIGLTSELHCVAQHYSELLSACAGVYVDIHTQLRHRQNSDDKAVFTASLSDQYQCEQVISLFGHDADIPPKSVNKQFIADNENMSAFVRGLFIACGYVADPTKDYHLEISVQNAQIGICLFDILKQCGMEPKSIIRKGTYILYYKESEQIEDFLTFMGAVKSSMTIMEVKIVKDVRNRANRITNCETANITKTVDAAYQQIKAIEYIDSHGGMDSLPIQLREIAKMRIDNPDSSLRELGEMLTPPLSRSGVNHRLKRIIEIYDAMNIENTPKKL